MTQQRMRRIIAHWTGGGPTASTDDREHYHRLTQQDCTIVRGTEAISDNIVTSDGDYAAHTLRLNTGSIGVALCGMHDATEYPFNPGPWPITEQQFGAFCAMIATLCREYAIPVTPKTVLTHAEVETNLGVKQRGKWDISVLPWDRELCGSRAVGDHLRATVQAMLGTDLPVETNRPTLRTGDHGVSVAELQSDLAALGYFSGRHDGAFGPLTRAAVLAFQADQGLATDGVVGGMTWAALAAGEPRPIRDITQEEIDDASGTAKDARMTERVGDVLGVGGALTATAQVSDQLSAATDTLTAASGTLGRLSAALMQNWPIVALCAACLLAWVALRTIGHTTRKRRLRDAQENRSLAR